MFKTRNEFICHTAAVILASKPLNADKLAGEQCVTQAKNLADALEVYGVAVWQDTSPGAAHDLLNNRPRQAPGLSAAGNPIAQVQHQIVEGNGPLPIPAQPIQR